MHLVLEHDLARLKAALDAGADPDLIPAPAIITAGATSSANSSSGTPTAASSSAKPAAAAAVSAISPLHAAIQAGWLEAVRLLVQHGACLSARTPEGARVHRLCLSSCGGVQVVKFTTSTHPSTPGFVT